MRFRFLIIAPLLAAGPASGHGGPGAGVLERLELEAAAFGAPLSVPRFETAPIPSAPVTPAAADLEPLEGQVNFEYAEMVDRFETLRRVVVRGSDGRRRRVEVPNGVTPADRVGRGEIRKIVLHASGGAGSCDGSVSHLLNARTAAHFIVCRDGRVTRMVKIEDIGNHVKNVAVGRESVGIETESGHPRVPYFRLGDWSPDAYWRMYASLAWLVRAIARETRMPRDRAAIITHEEADRGIRGAHKDPGPHFDAGSYPAFELRFPGQAVTPREYLMRLVLDDLPPQIWNVASTSGADQIEVKDTNGLGLSHVRVWLLDAAGKPDTLEDEWVAPRTGLPPVKLTLTAPAEPGAYRVVARDLVGNTSAALLRVAPPSVAPAAPEDPAAPPPAERARLDLRPEPFLVTAALESQ